MGLLEGTNPKPVAIPHAERAWGFDGDGMLFRLVAESFLLRYPDGRDAFPALHAAQIDPYPHQISAVYDELLPRRPLRFLLADDPGAGKTIMTGLYIKERLLRGDLRRCLIVCPGSLVGQWQAELQEKFRLVFHTYDLRAATAKGEDPLARHRLVLARLDQIKGNEAALVALAAVPWDLIVFDEAHKLSASRDSYRAQVHYTKRYHVAKRLDRPERNLLFLTATPHNGVEEEFQRFLALLDYERFADLPWTGQPTPTRNVMRRLLKEQLLRFDGTPLFPERWAHTVTYRLSNLDRDLYERVTAYVCSGMSRAEQHYGNSQKQYGSAIGFALMTLQRRLASSPEAILCSLRRRRERLEALLTERQGARAAARAASERHLTARLESILDAERDDASTGELTDEQERLVAFLTPALTDQELAEEIAEVRALEALAARARAAKTDRKWTQLRRVLNERRFMFDNTGKRRKLIIFTEHRDTLRFLLERIQPLLTADGKVVTIHGGMSQRERDDARAAFMNDERVPILIATDAAGEGINLQCAHLMINYDLPWNPNRLEQRFGRIHRIGQKEICHVWHLVAPETREGKVFAKLLGKLEVQRKDLGGRVFDILGALFPEQELRTLLIQAVRGSDNEYSRQQFERQVEDAVSDYRLQTTSKVQLVGQTASEPTEIAALHDRLARAREARIQASRVEQWFCGALSALGGSVRAAAPGYHELMRIPPSVRSRLAAEDGTREPQYVTFALPSTSKHGRPGSVIALVAPGEPLFNAVADALTAAHRHVLDQGAVLMDDNESNPRVRLLYLLEHRVAIEIPGAGEAGKASSQRTFTLEMAIDWPPDGSAIRLAAQQEVPEDASVATPRPLPDIPYRAPTSQESAQIRRAFPLQRLREEREELERQAIRIAEERVVQEHASSVVGRAFWNICHQVENSVDRVFWESDYISQLNQTIIDASPYGKRQREAQSAKVEAEEQYQVLAARWHERIERMNEAVQLLEQPRVKQPPTSLGVALIVPALACHRSVE